MDLETTRGVWKKPSFKELVLYSPRSLSPVPEVEFKIARDFSECDGLDAVRCDPAVLQVQVTINTNQLLPETADLRCGASRREVSPEAVSFEETMRRHQAALLSLSPLQYDLLLRYADTLRKQRYMDQISLECGFCRNNGAAVSWYTSHALKNWRGRVQCPVLRAHRCVRCGATGERAHTAKHCPLRPAYW